MKRLLGTVKVLFFVVAWVYISVFIYTNFLTLKNVFKVDNWLYFYLSILCLFPAYFGMYFARFGLTKAFGMTISLRKQFYIFSHNMIMRYIPGGVWNQLDATVMLKDASKYSFIRSGKLVILEMYWRVIFGYVFFGIILFEKNPQWFIASFVVIAVGTYVASRRYPAIYLYSVRALFEQGLSNLLFYAASGVSFVFLFASFQPFIQTVANVYYIAAAFGLSWIGGFLFIPAPSGLGMRETIMAILMSKIGTIFTIGFSLVLLNRFLVLLRDVGMFAIAYLLVHPTHRATKK